MQGNFNNGYHDPVFGVIRNGVPLATDIGSWFTADVSLRYDLAETGLGLAEGASLGIGVNNLFNEQAPFVPSTDYDANNHDIRGRTVFFSLGANF